MRVATWNINSVRLRLNQVLRFIQVNKKLDVIMFARNQDPRSIFSFS